MASARKKKAWKKVSSHVRSVGSTHISLEDTDSASGSDAMSEVDLNSDAEVDDLDEVNPKIGFALRCS